MPGIRRQLRERKTGQSNPVRARILRPSPVTVADAREERHPNGVRTIARPQTPRLPDPVRQTRFPSHKAPVPGAHPVFAILRALQEPRPADASKWPSRRRAARGSHHAPLHPARRGLRARGVRRYARAVQRDGGGSGTPVDQGPRPGLGDRRVRHAPALDRPAHRARGGAGAPGRPDPGDPAPHRPLAARGGGHGGARRTYHHR